jgi:nucleoside-diphosphate-sugar epimerase
MTATVLLTGASSFTGLWIAEALAAAGFQVLAPLPRAREDYALVRLERVRRLEAVCEVQFACPFGSDALDALIRGQRRIDVLAQHGAQIAGYRDTGYDAAAAFAANTSGAPGYFRGLAERGAQLVLATGSVFEAGEGGDPTDPLAVTPYGLSKSLSNLAFAHYADWAGLRFGKFVIASPYGVFEERRFGWHLFRSWFAGETPAVRTPRYVRDHTPAPVLAAAYVHHLTALLGDPEASPVRRPSGWIAPQGDFARKVAGEAMARLGRDCPLILAEQPELEEPLVRVNSDPAIPADWDETGFWDDYVDWYRRLDAAGELA